MITPCSTTPWRINNTRASATISLWQKRTLRYRCVYVYLRSTSHRRREHECSCFPNFPVARWIRPSEGNRTPWRRRLADSVAPGQSAASPFRPDQCQGVNCAPGVWWPECGVGFHHPHDSFLITWQYSRPCSQHVCHHNYLHLTAICACNANCARGSGESKEHFHSSMRGQIRPFKKFSRANLRKHDFDTPAGGGLRYWLRWAPPPTRITKW